MFLAWLRTDGAELCQSELVDRLASLRHPRFREARALRSGSFGAIVLPGAVRPGADVAHRRYLTAVGDVRLDNPDDVASWARGPFLASSHLDLVLAAVEARGFDCIADLHGDFAIVIWDSRAQRVIAARDAFGVKPLYLRRRRRTLELSSTVAPLVEEGAYDPEHVADFLVGGDAPPERTIWAGVEAVPAAGILVQRGSVSSVRRHWSVEQHVPAESGDERELCAAFREVFADAVYARLRDAGPAWAHLSGGLDSSSIVGMTRRLEMEGRLEAGLRGTITVVDTLGDGDERAYSDAVVRQLGVPNQTVVDYWAWQDDGVDPPITDEPRAFYPFFARNHAIARIVRGAGASVLLSGLGSDHYLAGDLSYVADMAARGQAVRAMRELARWSVVQRQSFWQLSRRHLLHPLLPAWLGRRSRPVAQAVPAWLDAGFARRYGVRDRMTISRHWIAPRGRAFAHTIARNLCRISGWIDRTSPLQGVEVRYPFLYRPLVEFSLRLPISMRVRPDGSKWVLREAMRDVLPETVRTRTTKGGIDARILWSLERERRKLDMLLRDPILAQLGCVDAHALRNALDRARAGEIYNLSFLLCALSLESWLAVRAGRWPLAEPARADTAA